MGVGPAGSVFNPGATQSLSLLPLALALYLPYLQPWSQVLQMHQE